MPDQVRHNGQKIGAFLYQETVSQGGGPSVPINRLIGSLDFPMSPTAPLNKNTVDSGRSSSNPDLVWIAPGFALGSKPYDYQRRAVAQVGIRMVVALYEPLAGEAEAWHALGIRFNWVPTRDWVQIPVSIFDRVVEIVAADLNSSTPVLLHCLAGINRAPTFAAAVLCQTRGMNVDQALAEVKGRRAAAKPTPEQEKSLRVWYDLRCK
jgi:hypothetical protein